MRALVIGGTRNLGYFIVPELVRGGWAVTLLNRGLTPDDLPTGLERLRADRAHPAELTAALRGRSFEAVIDTALYTGDEARTITALLSGRVGRYVFVSTGQVYLARAGISPPFREADYGGPLIGEPHHGSPDHGDWLYGIGKREAEDAFADAWSRVRFPYTSLRLPMVISERDHYGRVQAYLARLHDGGPILLPHEAAPSLRPVYAGDVASALSPVLSSPAAVGRAFNLAQPAPLQLSEVLQTLARTSGRELRVTEMARSALEERRLLPGCSPFSTRWMSELDSARGVAELGIAYTDPADYLAAVARDYISRWVLRGLIPPGYDRRDDELAAAIMGPGSGSGAKRRTLPE